jgi:serpin B
MMTIIRRYAGALAAAVAALVAGSVAAEPGIAAETRTAPLAQAYNAAGHDLYGRLAAAPGNLVFSPWSVGAAMSMLIAGARGDTAAELLRAMSLRMTSDAIDTANADMLAILNGYDRGAGAKTCPPPATLNAKGNCEAPQRGDAAGPCPPGLRLIGDRCLGSGTTAASAKVLAANALMLHRNGDLVSADYVTTLKTRYAAEIFRNAGLEDVNGWVALKTEGKISHMLDVIDSSGAATIINAVYFKARWASAFDPHLTHDEAFNLTETEKADVAFMNQTGRFPLVSDDGYRAIRLDYQVPELGLVIVLPDGIGDGGAVAQRLGAEALAGLMASLRDGATKKEVALALPRFRIAFSANLRGPFQQAGVQKALDPNHADFSGLTGRPSGGESRFYVDEIAHRAVIEVSEESTEAAAATATGVRAITVATPFRADHPFLFYLVDGTTGAILFQGRVADPR